MLDILFGDSGYLKYYDYDTDFNYSYTINTFDYPTLHSHVDYWEFCIITEGTIKNRIEGKRAEIYPEKTLSFMSTSDKHSYHKISPRVRYINISVRESHLLQLLNIISPTLKECLLQGPRHFPISDFFNFGNRKFVTSMQFVKFCTGRKEKMDCFALLFC